MSVVVEDKEVKNGSKKDLFAVHDKPISPRRKSLAFGLLNGNTDYSNLLDLKVERKDHITIQQISEEQSSNSKPSLLTPHEFASPDLLAAKPPLNSHKLLKSSNTSMDYSKVRHRMAPAIEVYDCSPSPNNKET